MKMNGGFSAHARKQVFPCVAIKRDDDSNALAHLGKVAAGWVLVRQQGELPRCCLDNLLHMSGEGRAGVSVYRYIDILANGDVIDGALINIGSHRDGLQIGQLIVTKKCYEAFNLPILDVIYLCTGRNPVLYF